MASLTDLQKSFIPGRGYVPAVKAGKKALRRAADQRKSPSANRPGPTARDRQDVEGIRGMTDSDSEALKGPMRELKSPNGVYAAKPLKHKTDGELTEKLTGKRGDFRAAYDAVKRIGGKRGLRSNTLSPADGPIDLATGAGSPLAIPGHKVISAGTGFKEGGGLVGAYRRKFHTGARAGKQAHGAGRAQREATERAREVFGEAGSGGWLFPKPPKPISRMVERLNPRMGQSGKLPGGRDGARKAGKEHPNQGRNVATHEAAHVHEMGSSRDKRLLDAGHITERQYSLRASSRRARHDAKNPTGPKYATKEEARSDARTRQVLGGDESGRRFVSGHDMEEGFVDSFNDIKRGMNRTEKRRRKQGRGKHHMVDRIITHDQARSGVKKALNEYDAAGAAATAGIAGAAGYRANKSYKRRLPEIEGRIRSGEKVSPEQWARNNKFGTHLARQGKWAVPAFVATGGVLGVAASNKRKREAALKKSDETWRNYVSDKAQTGHKYLTTRSKTLARESEQARNKGNAALAVGSAGVVGGLAGMRANQKKAKSAKATSRRHMDWYEANNRGQFEGKQPKLVIVDKPGGKPRVPAADSSGWEDSRAARGFALDESSKARARAKKATRHAKNWRRLAIAGGLVAVGGKYGGDKMADAKMQSSYRHKAKANRIERVGYERSRDNALAKASFGVPPGLQQPPAPAAGAAAGAAPAAPAAAGPQAPTANAAAKPAKKKPAPKVTGVSKAQGASRQTARAYAQIKANKAKRLPGKATDRVLRPVVRGKRKAKEVVGAVKTPVHVRRGGVQKSEWDNPGKRTAVSGGNVTYSVDPAREKYFGGSDPRGNQATREMQRNARFARKIERERSKNERRFPSSQIMGGAGIGLIGAAAANPDGAKAIANEYTKGPNYADALKNPVAAKQDYEARHARNVKRAKFGGKLGMAAGAGIALGGVVNAFDKKKMRTRLDRAEAANFAERDRIERRVQRHVEGIRRKDKYGA